MLIFFIIYFLISLTSSIHFQKTKQSLSARNFDFKTSELWVNFEKVPWKMFPLILFLFILIQLFNIHGITNILARILNYLNTDVLASMLMPIFSAISANIMINQPMTIFFANALSNVNYVVENSVKLTNGLGLIIGTNLGGNLTLFGALAGLMWKKILTHNNIDMSYKLFLHYSLKITLLVILITSIVLLIQMKFLF
jgi:arsenical pump membrane protein